MTKSAEVDAQLEELNTLYNRSMGHLQALTKELDLINTKISLSGEQLEVYDKTRIFLQTISLEARVAAKERLELLVTSALQYVFGGSYAFEIVLKGSTKPEADFLVSTDFGSDRISIFPTYGKGGGIVDLVSVALKFGVLELMGYDGPVWMDESFKHVSKKYRPEIFKLLQFMNEVGGRQIINITHAPELAEDADKAIKIFIDKRGVSHISQN